MSGTTASYDVFLSYARADAAPSQVLDASLRAQRLRTFFDRRELRAGLRWITALEEAIGNSGAVAILIGQHGLGNTQQYERELALVRQTQDRDFPVIPVLLPGCEKPPTGFLELLTWVDLRDGISVRDRPDGLQSLLAAIRREPVDSAAIRGSICPYMGLEPFHEEDAAFFCGRDRMIESLVAQVHEHPFVAVVGRSGSGKSSLVFAGLLPALRRQRETTVWDVVTLRPTTRPLHALARVFNPEPPAVGVFAGQDWLDDEAAALRSGSPGKLAPVIAHRLDESPEKPDRLLLYVDQWEELYAMGPGSEATSEQRQQHTQDVERFIALLLAVASDPRARTSVVLTVRADFYGPLITHPAVSALLPRQQVNIEPMSHEGLRTTIVTPAEKVGLAFDPPNVVTQILEDAGDDEGSLPLLEYALKETWANREGNRLTADGYSKAGRVQGAIQATAERTFNALTANEQNAARRLFLGLVRPGEGREDTRARIAMPDDPALLAVATKFADLKSRLLVTGWEPVPLEPGAQRPTIAAATDIPSGRATLEVAHEALIRSWSTLRSWLDANRDQMRARAAILQQQREWETNNYSDDLLLPSGFYLERGRKLINDPGDVPVADIAHFINASVRKEERRLADDRETTLAAERKNIAEIDQQRKERRFLEAVEKAESDDFPTMLALLAEEAKRLPWGREGLRFVGRAQRRLMSFLGARETWETVRRDLPDDIEANLMLATIYQRLGNNVMASQACRRVLENKAAPPAKLADAHSQLARNEKAAWAKDFAALETQDGQQQAISDQRLIDALEGYQAGFTEDLNDYYSGLNALGLVVALERLADSQPDSWASLFPNARRASAALDDYRDQLKQLTGAVRISLDNAKTRSDRAGIPDEWLLVSEAQYRLLTADNPAFVRNAYRTAKNALGERFQLRSELSQVAIFRRLGLLADNCSAAFAGLGATPADLQPKEPPPRDRVVVATGHRADAPSRPPPGRFPNTAACIDKAKGWLRQALQAEKTETAGTLYGIAGAASGVDLLFHEVCKEVGIPTKVCLPIPIEAYKRESVADGGSDWVEKFNHFIAEHPPIILSDSDELPAWAAGIKDYGVFQRGNIWNMRDALLRPNADVTLIALWNQKAGEGPGGTADMVKLAKSHGAKVREQNSDELFGIALS